MVQNRRTVVVVVAVFVVVVVVVDISIRSFWKVSSRALLNALSFSVSETFKISSILVIIFLRNVLDNLEKQFQTVIISAA